MAFCSQCGTSCPAGVKFCPACGQSLSRPAPPPAAEPASPGPAAFRPTPQYQYGPGYGPAGGYADQPPPADSRYAVLSTWSYVGSIILFSIPLLGWFICLVCACGGARNQNKRHLARAAIIMLLIALGVSALLNVLILWGGGMLPQAGGLPGDSLLALREALEAALKYVNELIAARKV